MDEIPAPAAPAPTPVKPSFSFQFPEFSEAGEDLGTFCILRVSPCRSATEGVQNLAPLTLLKRSERAIVGPADPITGKRRPLNDTELIGVANEAVTHFLAWLKLCATHSPFTGAEHGELPPDAEPVAIGFAPEGLPEADIIEEFFGPPSRCGPDGRVIATRYARACRGGETVILYLGSGPMPVGETLPPAHVPPAPDPK